MKSMHILNIVASECEPEVEEKFNKWYNEVHIPMILKYKGITGASRYRRAGDNKEHPKYIAFYEFESREALEVFQKSPEFMAAGKDMQETWKGSEFEIKWVVEYEPIKTWER